jgi:hypothetical protein
MGATLRDDSQQNTFSAFLHDGNGRRVEQLVSTMRVDGAIVMLWF